ncbi:beta-lactamase family protein [Catenulispora sp. NL8]|uniref:Beta-lactamase family protein n=1 Tax=Catenulispora pinistramenti TaxID=2705254 RepID=A0ABS5L180_9ACTN|nr:serine hydrolase domain-containing protein [Catenulispora pinistramenti]MBS2552080.1 beta-lactamase family protein [Catenulispora pinistramenti]
MKRWTVGPVAALLVGATVTAWTFPADSSASAPGVQHALDVLTHDDGLPGAVARVTEASHPARTSVSGVGDVDSRAPMPADGHLRMASNVKSMVATVVLQLVAERKVGLDTSLATYLPGVVPPRAGDADAITIRELLQHTSGLHEYSDGLPSHQNFAPFVHYTRDQLLQRAFAKGPDFPPGTQYRYSNTGYILLGMVIEKVTGQPWRDEVTRRIFEPVGMRDSYFPAAYEYGLRGVYAHGYMQLPAAGGAMTEADVTHLDPSGGDANGDGISTPGDLAKFYTALFGGQLLPAGLLAEMEKVVATPSPPGSPELAYGLGIGRYTLPCGGYAWGNAGTTNGFQTISGLTLDARGRVAREVTIEVNSTFGPQPAEATHFFDALFAGLCPAH